MVAQPLINEQRILTTDQVSDESTLKNYRTELPNIIDDFGLEPYAHRLYTHYKRANGMPQGIRHIAKICCMSVGKATDAKKDLIEAGLIWIEPVRSSHGDMDKVTVPDLWEFNFRIYAERDRVKRAELIKEMKRSLCEHPLYRSSCELIRSRAERLRSLCELKKESSKNKHSRKFDSNLSKIEASAAPERDEKQNPASPEKLNQQEAATPQSGVPEKTPPVPPPPKLVAEQVEPAPADASPKPAEPISDIDENDLANAFAQIAVTELVEGWYTGSSVADAALPSNKWYLHDAKNGVVYNMPFKTYSAALSSPLCASIRTISNGGINAYNSSGKNAWNPKLLIAEEGWQRALRAYYDGFPAEFRPSVQDMGTALETLAKGMIQNNPTPDLLPEQIKSVMAAQYAPASETKPAGYWRNAGSVLPFKTLALNFNLWLTQLTPAPAAAQTDQPGDTDNPYLQDDYFKRHADEDAVQHPLFSVPEPEQPREINQRYKDSWIATLGQLKIQLNQATFQNWLGSVELVEAHDYIWTVRVPNKYVKDWLEPHLLHSMKQTLFQINRNIPDDQGQIVFEVVEESVTA